MKAASVLLLSLFGATPRGEVVEVTGQNCVYCRQMEPIVLRMQRNGLPIRQVHADQDPGAARKYGVSGLPTFLLMVDGKEVERIEGAVDESALMSLVKKIPEPTKSPEPSSTAAIRVELGESSENAPEVQPRPESSHDAVAMADTKETSIEDKGFDLLKPFRRKRQEPEIRGQSTELQPRTGRSAESAFDASVRLRVVQNGKALIGSGTIVDSRPGRSYVVTCANLFAGADETAKIEVDVPNDPQGGKYIAALANVDRASDMAVLTINTDAAIPSAIVAPLTKAPQVGDAVVSIGASEGRELSREQIRVQAVNKYEGADNLECSGVPTQGRCGGGLFNSSGELIGLCIASGNEPNTGFYAGLPAVHDLLKSVGLDTAPAVAPQSDANNETNLANIDLGASQETPASTQPAAKADDLFADFSRDTAAPATALDGNAEPRADFALTQSSTGGQELIVILPSQEPGNPRVMVIHKPSPKLMAFLNGEMNPAAGGQASGTAQAGRTPQRATARRESGALQASTRR